LSAAVVARTGALLASAALAAGVTSCGGGSSGPGSTGGGGAGGAKGHCSDPHPSNLALTFAAIVCVQKQTTVPQSDGSSELKLLVQVTDKDPNAFDVTTTDFKLLDAAGHDVAADPAASPGSGRAGSSDCIYQQPADRGFPISPEKTLTVPGPICFNLRAGERPHQLVWQDDVSVNLG